MSKRKVLMPTPEEDAAINRGIAEDPDTFELNGSQIKQLKPLGKRIGRPKSDHPKVSVTIRFDSEIVEAFRMSGDGWQTRMNNALRDWLRTHKI
ncbi:BrnA antitoxin family protein [Imbroritus primus]|uniref:BrnA antitoxin family protein n=1 Tax=Imbroritus primus TaxID=3058603 RepID=UPI003D16153F